MVILPGIATIFKTKHNSKVNMRSFRRRELKGRPEHQEIDVLEFLLQLWKGRKIISCSMVVALGIAITYLWVQKPIWVSTAVVSQPDPGQVASYTNTLLLLYPPLVRKEDAANKFLPSISDIRAEVFERFSILLTASTTHGMRKDAVSQEVLKVALQPGTPTPVQLSYTSSSPEQLDSKLRAFIEGINQGVEKQLIDDLKANIVLRKQELSAALVIQEQLEKQQRVQRSEVKDQYKDKDGNVPAVSVNNAEWLPDYADEYLSTQEQLLRITSLDPEKMKIDSFYYVIEPGQAVQQKKQASTTLVLLSLILGGIIGAGIVLIKNALRNYRQSR